MSFEEMKDVLARYGEPLDEDELELFESSMNVADGKIIVHGSVFNSTLPYVAIIKILYFSTGFTQDFIKLLSPLVVEAKKKKKSGKKGKKGVSPKRK